MDDVDLSTARHFRYELRLGGKFSAAIWSAGGVPRITSCKGRKEAEIKHAQCGGLLSQKPNRFAAALRARLPLRDWALVTVSGGRALDNSPAHGTH